jgi:hypothetical protein
MGLNGGGGLNNPPVATGGVSATNITGYQQTGGTLRSDVAAQLVNMITIVLDGVTVGPTLPPLTTTGALQQLVVRGDPTLHNFDASNQGGGSIAFTTVTNAHSNTSFIPPVDVSGDVLSDAAMTALLTGLANSGGTMSNGLSNGGLNLAEPNSSGPAIGGRTCNAPPTGAATDGANTSGVGFMVALGSVGQVLPNCALANFATGGTPGAGATIHRYDIVTSTYAIGFLGNGGGGCSYAWQYTSTPNSSLTAVQCFTLLGLMDAATAAQTGIALGGTVTDANGGIWTLVAADVAA